MIANDVVGVSQILRRHAIDYESGRGEILDKLNEAAGFTVGPEGPEIFSRTIQSSVGIATGATRCRP